jgi:translocation and assembly module TamA
VNLRSAFLWRAVLAASCGAAGTVGCAHDTLGTGVAVHDLEIEGNEALSDGEILDRLATQRPGWWPFAAKRWFDQAAFDLDLERIPSLYADRGYFDARVVRHDVKPRADGTVDIVVGIQENQPTRISQVQLTGLPPGEESAARKLVRRSGAVPGRTFDYDAYAGLRAGIDAQLRDHGHAYAKVEGEVEVDRDHRTAVIMLPVRPGPEVRFGNITVEGNGAFPAHAIENRASFQAGDTYDPRDLAATQAHIYELGVFSSVRLEIPDQPAEVADVRVKVSPGPLRQVRLGGGIGIERVREEVRARLEYTRANFLGGLRTLRVRFWPAYVVIPSVFDLQRSGPAAETDVQLTQPDILRSNVTARAMVGYDLEIYDGYQYYGPRAQLAAERLFLRHLLHDRGLGGLSWNLQYLTFFNVAPGVLDQPDSRFFGFQNPYRLAYVEAFGQLDLRDHPLDPRAGAFLMVRSEVGSPGLGSDFHYVKVTPDARLYAPLGGRVAVAVRGLFGWLHNFGSQTSPITRRYALGGPSSHRGFSLGRLAPQVKDSAGNLIPIGGDAEVLFSGELRIRVTKIGGSWLGITPFFDAGDVTPSLLALDLGNLNYATGGALEYQTPIGAVRAGFGVRLNRMGDGNPDPNDRMAFYITIGEAF